MNHSTLNIFKNCQSTNDFTIFYFGSIWYPVNFESQEAIVDKEDYL